MLFWLFLVLDDLGLEICFEYFDNLVKDEKDEWGEFGLELVGEGGGDCVRYLVILNIVDESFRWLGEL